MSFRCSSHILWRYTVLRDHSHHYPITGITKCLERLCLEILAFLVLIWVEKESSERQTDLTCMNVALLQLLLLLHYNACSPKFDWQCRLLRTWPASRVAQCDKQKSEIWNLQLLSEVVESFQPVGGAPPDFTDSDAESHYSVMAQARCPLISWISCSKSWLPYYYISSVQS